MRLTGVLATHYHADHIGGSMMGFNVRGISELLEYTSVPIHLQRDELDYVTKTTGVSKNELTLHDSGDIVQVGSLDIELIHTPGHTPGSVSLYFADARDPVVFTGDALFAGSVGRTDCPGGDMDTLLDSIRHVLLKLPGPTRVLSGHGPETTVATEAASNPCL